MNTKIKTQPKTEVYKTMFTKVNCHSFFSLKLGNGMIDLVNFGLEILVQV